MKLSELLKKLESIDVDPSEVELKVIQAENGWTYDVTNITIERPAFTPDVYMILEVEDA